MSKSVDANLKTISDACLCDGHSKNNKEVEAESLASRTNIGGKNIQGTCTLN